MLIGDKVGEIYFVNLKNLDKLPKDPEARKHQGDQEEADDAAKLIYGHQQACIGMFRSLCGRYMVSIDTLHNIVVNNFPNIVNLQSVNCDQQAKIGDICFFEDKIATFSQDPDQPECKLLITSLIDGSTTL